ncbi:MAG: sugar-binding protein [Pseudomonadota bacterium]
MHKAITGLVATIVLFQPLASFASDDSHLEGRSEYRAPKAAMPPVVNGIADEAVWATADWRQIGERWLGPAYSPTDYSGRFKVVWTAERLYLLGEFVDDVLYDAHRNPLVQYWDDDTLEVFLDEDHSGGEHHFSHNAFAYHVSLDNRAIDIGTDRKARDYSHHVESRWRQEGGRILWEVAINVYDDTYIDGGDNNVPVGLFAGKIMGFMVAYCDNDGSELRENFVGSEIVSVGATDRGYIDAGIFGTLILAD